MDIDDDIDIDLTDFSKTSATPILTIHNWIGYDAPKIDVPREDHEEFSERQKIFCSKTTADLWEFFTHRLQLVKKYAVGLFDSGKSMNTQMHELDDLIRQRIFAVARSQQNFEEIELEYKRNSEHWKSETGKAILIGDKKKNKK